MWWIWLVAYGVAMLFALSLVAIGGVMERRRQRDE